jgi:virulence-associated protein VagC
MVDTVMTILALRLSDEPIVTLPAELAYQAGLEEGEVQVILGEHSLTVAPITASLDYTLRWEAMAARLREQAAQFDLPQEDCRDASYWEIVTPLFEEAERTVSSA